MKKCIVTILLFLASSLLFAAPDLTLSPQDIAAVRGDENGLSASGEGVHLFIRRKEGVNSVLLVETTKDPAGKEDNFAYRALEWNKFNGDEIRMLDGQILTSESARYSLVSSTVEDYGSMGPCFHIYLPPEIQFGYPWTRNGTVTIGKGTFINFRTFEKPYADYSGEFKDNPFMFDFPEPPVKKNEAKKDVEKVVDEKPREEISIPVEDFNTAAARKFSEIADKSNGLFTYCLGPEYLSGELVKMLEEIEDKRKVDLVFAIDTTGSMKDDLDMLRRKWVPLLMEQAKSFGRLRIGLILYRDYNDDYLWKNLPVRFYDFTEDVNVFYKNLNTVVIDGLEGGDEPEAVYEALYAALKYYKWDSGAVRKVILIGDAPPHSRPRGTAKKISESMVLELSAEKGVQVNCIIVPNKI